MPTGPAVLLFDGTCNLCDKAVRFVLDHERAPTLTFASLQSDAARAILEPVVGPGRSDVLRSGLGKTGDPGSVVLVEEGCVYTDSEAALRIARHLRWPWRAFATLSVVPRPLRDGVYQGVARRRYGWFGKAAACQVRSPDLAKRFL